jgi:hypothetical protein
MVDVIWVLGAGLAMLAALLPVRLRCRWDCPTVPREAGWYVTGGPWLGLLGVYIQGDLGGWRVGPALAGRSGPGVRFGGTPPTPTATSARSPSSTERDAPPEERPGKSRRGRLARHWVAPLARFARSLPNTVRLRRVRIQGCWGAADPAHTGLACGAVHALRPLLPTCLDLDLAPDFQRPGFRGQVEVCLWFHPGLALLLLGRLMANIAWISLRRRWAARP